MAGVAVNGKTGVSALLEAAAIVMNSGDVFANPSISRAAAPSILTFRVFIDELLKGDEILTDVVRMHQGLAMAFVINAFQLNQLVTGTKTIQDFTKLVATEDMQPYFDGADMFASLTGLEGFTAEMDRDQLDRDKFEYQKKRDAERDARDSVNDYNRAQIDAQRTKIEQTKILISEEDKLRKEKKEAADAEYLHNQKNNTDLVHNGRVSAKQFELDVTGSIPMGKLVEITMSNPQHPDNKITFNLLIKLLPTYAKPDVIQMLINIASGTGFVESIFRRFLQLTSGEISFFHDWFFGLDRVVNRRNAMRQDKDGVVYEYIQNNLKQNRRAMKRAVDMLAGREVSQNIANSIMIFDYRSVLRAKAETGFDLFNKDDRKAFFEKSFSTMISVIDTLHNKVHLFIDGIDADSTFDFAMVKHKSKGLEQKDLLATLTSLSQNRAIRF